MIIYALSRLNIRIRRVALKFTRARDTSMNGISCVTLVHATFDNVHGVFEYADYRTDGRQASVALQRQMYDNICDKSHRSMLLIV